MRNDSDREIMSRQEQALQFEKFDRADAWQLGESIKKICESRSVALAIEVRLSKETVFYYSMRGTTSNNANWARRKRNVVELMEQSSYAVGDSLEREGGSFESTHGLPSSDYAAFGGSFPIVVKGCGCVGAVTVSGLPQREDHCIAVEALAALCGASLADITLA